MGTWKRAEPLSSLGGPAGQASPLRSSGHLAVFLLDAQIMLDRERKWGGQQATAGWEGAPRVPEGATVSGGCLISVSILVDPDPSCSIGHLNSQKLLNLRAIPNLGTVDLPVTPSFSIFMYIHVFL